MTCFLGLELLVRFEKHPKAVSGALRDRFRAREVFGAFEKRTPDLNFFKTFWVSRHSLGGGRGIIGTDSFIIPSHFSGLIHYSFLDFSCYSLFPIA